MTPLNTDFTKPDFTVVPDAFYDDCHDMPQVFQCAFCAKTFCDSCTDLEAWLNDAIKACPHCGYISPNQPGAADAAAQPEFSDSVQIQVLVNADAATLEAPRRQHGFTARLCNYTEYYGMEDLDEAAAEALQQFAIHLGLPYQDNHDITQVPITLRTALSHAALDSPAWEDHNKVSKRLLHHLNLQFGAELAELFNGV